ncbi:protein EFFECTOR OF TRANSCRIPTION 2-like [Andrographis paniculata]|uniref:protein EFFECTOR OF TRANSCRIPTION 2-like n=1 Tax=Andrographis paniculata TaxID=175694 RepID=UPI0021E7F5FD|nr:protein EFFECTOR OF TRANSCRIPTION 2-like [Andrographis paniculata]XP_051150283.1 protein EFFECTOR OF TRANSCRIPTION 2-like [Andrographis paniculata]XP_051150284.1 protein EFFECTOR OF TRANSCRIPTION 2-like [Andrographis paniculata]XP_051150286.1 protein EFFECTOR OF TRANSCRIPTION 2-like [Andrographis paniculata]XP_051150287.1 protein EFFECTOR OF TRANSCRIPTION 2-like [Andrographis paniculata]
MAAPPTPKESTAAGRMKREDYRRTNHDSAFTDWKILVGPFDWEEHEKGKEGAERYRVQNLPNLTPCPGVYELGIGVSRLESGREPRKFDSSCVLPVYVGQADNLRYRLQRYGRDGAHLENGCSNRKFTDTECVHTYNGPGLFTLTFSRGFPILYRYAIMQSKKEAEMTEKKMLENFDYAWNKGGNGVRRDDDIFQKLQDLSKASRFYLLAKKLLDFNQKPVGIKIENLETDSCKNGSNTSDTNNGVTFSKIYGIKKVKPEQVQNGCSDHVPDICGVVSNGSVCTAPPVKGRKRCAEHKGMRVKSSNSKPVTKVKTSSNTANLDSNFQDQPYIYEESSNDIGPICGFVLNDGSPCRRKPFQKNKRCLEHKGRRIRKSYGM